MLCACFHMYCWMHVQSGKLNFINLILGYLSIVVSQSKVRILLNHLLKILRKIEFSKFTKYTWYMQVIISQLNMCMYFEYNCYTKQCDMNDFNWYVAIYCLKETAILYRGKRNSRFILKTCCAWPHIQKKSLSINSKNP